jgi:sugar lactone lactonase YvrE
MSSRACAIMRICVVVVSAVFVLLAGCSSNSFKNPTNLHLEGVAMGGQQPIGVSTLQLYAVNTSGTGPTYTSTPLLPVGAAALTTSDGSGNATNSNANAGNSFNSLPVGYFTITNDYTCPSPGAQVYLAANGGVPGPSVGTNNSDIAIMLALGACGQLSGSTSVQINEVTTVGSIAALYPYMTAYNAVGSPSGNADYLAEEFSVANEYMNAATGVAPGAALSAGYYASSNEVNTLANLVATCVNTAGGSAGDGSACGNIFLAAKPPGQGSTAPTDTVGLMIDILNNPTNNVPGIYNNISTQPPFFPYDLSAPSDWTLPIVPVAQTPTASPAAGTYAGAQMVTLTTQNSTAAIYYTTDGTTPTTSSSVYSGPVTVSASETLQAISGNRGGVSAAGVFGYNITGAAATPVISLAEGSYSSVQTFTVTSATPDAAVYVTTDGTTPTAASTLVTGALQLDRTETLKAVAIAGNSSSGMSSAAYTFTSGIINTIAGGGIPNGDNIAATSAELNGAFDVAVDASGNLYIADYYNARIRKVTAATGVITTVAGNGTSGFTGDGGLATSAEINHAYGVVVDASGNLYIADTGNNRIRMVTASTGVITTVAGNGTLGFAGDAGAATSAELGNPIGVVFDAGGDLYISDSSNNRIRMVAAGTGIISTFAGNGTAGYSADGVAATSSELNSPYGIALDAGGNLYIADATNNRVRKVSATTGIITTVAGNGTQGFAGDGSAATSSEMYAPTAVAVDANGNLYIVDRDNSRVREVLAATGIISTFAGGGSSPSTCSGSTDSVGDGCAATSANIDYPYGVALDTSGNLYIPGSNSQRVRKVTAGIITTVAGNGIGGYAPAVPDGVLATASLLTAPNGAAVDASGNLYIADTTHHRIRKVTVATGVITTVAGSGVQCALVNGACGDGSAATSAQLNGPKGVAVDGGGNLYIADTSDNRIRKVTLATGVITTVAGTGVAGFLGDNGQAINAKIDAPYGVAVDASGNLYIADTSNQRIRLVTASSSVITTIAGSTPCTPATNTCGDTGAASSGKFNGPRGIALDASGNLYIADYGDNRIREITGGNIYTVAGNGTAGFMGDTGPATMAELHSPAGVAVDGSGNLYIADATNERVRKVTGGNIFTIAGNGTVGFTGDGSAATAAELSAPSGVAVDANGNVYIVDTTNNRIRVVNP